MSGNERSGRPTPGKVVEYALTEFAEDLAHLLEDCAGAKERCAIELARGLLDDLPRRLDGSRWGTRRKTTKEGT